MKATLAYVLLLVTAATAVAQKVENDDMYFTSKDRAKLKASAPVVAKNSEIKPSKKNEVVTAEQTADTGLNPTDSYSARNVNPEYTTKGSKTTGTTGADYFVEDYTPTGVNDKLGNRYANNSAYGTGSPYSNYSPYSYNSPYSSYGNPYSSYGNMGWGSSMNMAMGGMYGMYPGMSMMSMSYGMGYGSMYNPWMMGGMGMGYGMGYGSYSSMYNPYMYDPFMSMYCPYSFYGYSSYGYGSGSYGYPGGYGGGSVNNDPNNGRTVAHSRRTDRSTSENYVNDGTRSATTAALSRTGRAIAGGRARSSEQTEAYYQRGWRNNTATNGQSTNRSNWSNNGYDPGQSSSGSTGHNSSGRSSSSSSWSNWGNTGNSGSSWSGGSSAPARSSFGGGGGTSGGGGGAHHSSGGGTRGRD